MGVLLREVVLEVCGRGELVISLGLVLMLQQLSTHKAGVEGGDLRGYRMRRRYGVMKAGECWNRQAGIRMESQMSFAKDGCSFLEKYFY